MEGTFSTSYCLVFIQNGPTRPFTLIFTVSAGEVSLAIRASAPVSARVPEKSIRSPLYLRPTSMTDLLDSVTRVAVGRRLHLGRLQGHEETDGTKDGQKNG